MTTTTECFALSVNIRGGSSICISECGGIQLRSGELLIVQAPLAAALHKQYKPHLSEPIPARIEGRLRHSYYDTRRLNVLLNPKPEPDPEQAEQPEPKPEPVTESEEPKDMQDIASDRSMGLEPAKKKRKTKRTPTKAKRKKEEE